MKKFVDIYKNDSVLQSIIEKAAKDYGYEIGVKYCTLDLSSENWIKQIHRNNIPDAAFWTLMQELTEYYSFDFGIVTEEDIQELKEDSPILYKRLAESFWQGYRMIKLRK